MTSRAEIESHTSHADRDRLRGYSLPIKPGFGQLLARFLGRFRLVGEAVDLALNFVG